MLTAEAPRHRPAWRLPSAPGRPNGGLSCPHQSPPGNRPAGCRGACRREDPELFFPLTETHAAAGRQIAAAKAVCGRCLVRVTCLAYAMATGQDGVWGGTTGHERRAWRFAAGQQVAPGQAAGTRAAGQLTAAPDGESG